MEVKGSPQEPLQPAGTEDEVLLQADFQLACDRKSRYRLSLSRSELRLRRVVPSAPESRRTALELADCIGSQAFPGEEETDPGWYFAVYFYPLKKKWLGSLASRHRVVKTFRVAGCPNLEENQKTAEKWSKEIKRLLGHSLPNPGGLTDGLLPQPCHVLVLANPQSGKGQALQLFHTYVRPMLTEADIKFKLLVTEHPNHAQEVVREEDLTQWDALAIMSGDGLMHEVVNGLMERPDWETAIKKPLSILPGGSGNALAASINQYSGCEGVMNEELLINCTYLLCKGLVTPMDLVSLTLASKRLFSFLSVAWGFISDVDIESEKYRKMGSARFTVGTLVRLVSLRTYKGRLAYLPAKEAVDEQSKHSSDCIDNQLCSSFSCIQTNNTSSDKNCIHTLYNFCNSNNTAKVQSGDSYTAAQTPNGILKTKDSLLPLGQPVPNHWTVVKEEEFVLVLAIYQSHLGADLYTAPMAKPNDGIIHLFYIKAGISRAALLRLFLAMEKGTHLEHSCPHLVHVPVKAFRLEPYTPKGIMTVDGELVEYGPIQGQVHSGLSRIITCVGT
ncbi:sphingosine kinase 1 [Latimeria chalumnae]|uniref:sphingosine kinase 1 n=1 Tax=Latimeria chalumnae TaxID=7897 RepID=UPI0003C1027B|nr:PREDICTED: sphingosine kinase 1 [Latimeria chalumnae]|eukprot:XP_005993276.1 PREDICTED: sphingosine kinase 1 [Latimeria chalumnae]